MCTAGHHLELLLQSQAMRNQMMALSHRSSARAFSRPNWLTLGSHVSSLETNMILKRVCCLNHHSVPANVRGIAIFSALKLGST